MAHGLLARVTPEGGGRHVYQLTGKGRDFFPAYVALKAWADRWMTDEKGPLTLLQDRRTGLEICEPALARADGTPITLDDVRVLPGPGAGRFLQRRFGEPASIGHGTEHGHE
ncbi:hypothetical protein D3C72_1897810 [compost metagenome]